SGCLPAPSAMASGWRPTHARVLVLRARGLRPKAPGGSDAYAVMALGQRRFRTAVSERSGGQPVWREEATFELPPGPAALRLTVLHRALVGTDKFLGRAEVELPPRDGGAGGCRWYKLRSKPGKKEKERGEIEVDIQFMRSDLTASMFDLSAKDKPRSPFGKLKDKLKGKKSSGFSDTASEIIPSTTHSPADSEDEAAEKEKKKSKFKALFSKPGLQKTSLSQSMSVLPTQPSVTKRVRLHPKDFQPQWDDEGTDDSPTSESESGSSPSSVFKSRKTATLDIRQLNPGTTSHTKKEGLSLFSGLKSKSDPVSKSSLCINGSHVYMEESTGKDNSPVSSPSPHLFKRKQLFASEENLSSRPTKGPEEVGRMSPSHAFSGSASLETFKSMTLPSYKLLSSEEYPEPSVPPTAEVTRETEKTDHKKSTLLSLVTGKKEAVKTIDAESVPDRSSLQDEENKIPEEKSEQEAKGFELPADLSRGSPAGDGRRAEDVFVNKQLLNPFEEEPKPEKAAVPAKTKAVKPRLGASSEEETKAVLPTLAPESLPAFLSVQRVRSDNNPFVSKPGDKVQMPDSETVATSPASLTFPPPSAAEVVNSKNPFIPERDRTSTALDPKGVDRFPSSHHLDPKVPLPGQGSGSANNPFASDWGQSSQGPDRPDTQASRGLSHPPAASLPSVCRFNDNNPFASKLGQEADAPGFKPTAGSSPSCLPSDADGSAAELERSDRDAAGGSSAVAVNNSAKAVSSPPSSPSDTPTLAPKKQHDSPRLQAKTSLQSSKLGKGKAVAEQPPAPERELKEEQEILGRKRWEGSTPTLEPQASTLDRNDSFSKVRAAKPALGPSTLSPHDAGGERAGTEVSVAPKPAPRLKKCPPVPRAEGLSGDVLSSGNNLKATSGLSFDADKASDARGCLPQSSSLETAAPPATVRESGRVRCLKTEGDDDLFDCLTSQNSAIPTSGDRVLKLASLPVIPEGGSDDELLGDSQENRVVVGGDDDVSEAGKQSLGLVASHEELRGHPDSSAAARVTLASPGEGSAPGASELSRAAVDAHCVSDQVADSGLGVTCHSGEQNSHFEKKELKISAGDEERADHDFFEPSLSSSSLSSPSQPYSSAHSLLSDAPSRRAESPKKTTAEGFADKAGNSGKKKLLRAWVSPSETHPSQAEQGGEALSAKHRLHPVKPMNATATKPLSMNLNVLSTMNEKLLEMNAKKYDPTDPAYAYAQLTRDELIQLVLKQKDTITRKDLQVRELEDYIDNLLVRVMEETPNILRVSVSGNKKAGEM
ncbi:RFIP1 protein, partial [Piaya cayana]|nr:RFIP1 protein [Piaya cayana]